MVLKPDIPVLKPDMFFFVFGAQKSMSGLSSETRAQTGHRDVRFLHDASSTVRISTNGINTRKHPPLQQA